MRTKSFGLMITCALTLPSVAYAQALPLPDWKIPEICAKDSATGYCSAFEGRAVKTVSSSWAFVPDAVRKLCLEQIRRPEDRSWRVLGDCIDDAMERNIDRGAVKTARTPGEAVPPPKPIVVPPVVVPVVAATPPPAPVAVPVAPPPPPPLVVAAPVAPAPIVQPGAIMLPPIPFPTGSPMAALEAEVAQKRAAEAAAAAAAAATAAEAKTRAEAQAKAAAEVEAKRRADAEAQAQARIVAAAEAKRKADAEAQAAADAAAKRNAETAACQATIAAAGKSGVIRFAVASATLTPDSTPALDRVAAAAKACPTARLSVEGHTDSSGDPDRNLELSTKRAATVVAYLTKAGIEPWRVNAIGLGPTKPVASNESDEGKAQNRRIEFVAIVMDDAERKAAMDAESKRAAAIAAAAENQKAEIKLCQDTINTAVKSEPVVFKKGSATVTREAAAVLDRVAVAIKSCATGKIAVEGHIDATDDSAEEKELTQARAATVTKYLTRAGIDSKRLSAVGHGRAKPLAANDTEENRAKNRRIEFVVAP